MDKELEILRKYFSPLAKNKESLGLRNDAAFLDLKNTFLAVAFNFKSSIISKHLIFKLSTPDIDTGAGVDGGAI